MIKMDFFFGLIAGDGWDNTEPFFISFFLLAAGISSTEKWIRNKVGASTLDYHVILNMEKYSIGEITRK